MEKSINVSIAKSKRLLAGERNQEIRSSSNAHCKSNLQRQDARLVVFRTVEEESLGNELRS